MFSVFKYGMIGTDQHCGETHLHRYIVELDLRYNRRKALKVTSTERRDEALHGIEGKRLAYRRDVAPWDALGLNWAPSEGDGDEE